MQNYALSHLIIDSKTVKTLPLSKVPVTVKAEVIARDFIIWNCHGKVPHVAQFKKAIEKKE